MDGMAYMSIAVLRLQQMPKISLETLGRLAVAKRADLGVRAAAKEIGISPATLSRVERGYLPDLDTFGKICRWLEVDPGQVLGVTRSTSSTPKVAVHFKKQATLTPATAQALAQLVLAAHRAWLVTEDEG
jgi:DNA-binding Xre family transcriptional regulator